MQPENGNGNRPEENGTQTWSQIRARVNLEAEKGNLNPLQNYIIRPVTIKTDNITIGPRTLDEWAEYETELLHKIGRVIENKEEPAWEDLYFKNTKDFVSGIWTRNKENWRALIAQMPEASRSIIYHSSTKDIRLMVSWVLGNPSKKIFLSLSF